MSPRAKTALFDRGLAQRHIVLLAKEQDFLCPVTARGQGVGLRPGIGAQLAKQHDFSALFGGHIDIRAAVELKIRPQLNLAREIGRASCRERV